MGEQVAKIKRIYALSNMQKGMLFHSLLDNEDDTYAVQMLIYIEGKLDITAFEKSLNVLIQKYSVFRTVFAFRGLEEPKQIVLSNRKARVTFFDLSEYEDNLDNLHLHINRIIHEDRKKRFDLSKDLLIRVSVISISENRYKIIWSHHHIILDGWSLNITIKELIDIYNSILSGVNTFCEFETAPYETYIHWLGSQNRTEANSYWNTYLKGSTYQSALPKMNMSLRNNSVQETKYKQGLITVDLGQELSNRLKKTANDHFVTLNTLFQAIWGILLQKNNNTSDVIFGQVVSGRSTEINGIESMVGLLIHTLPVRVQSSKDELFSQLLKILQEKSVRSEKYGYLSLPEIQAAAECTESMIDSLFIFENYPISQIDKLASETNSENFSTNSVEIIEQTNYDMNIIIVSNETVQIKFSYNSYTYNHEYVESIRDQYLQIISEVIDNADIRVSEIEWVPEKERRVLLQDFNDTALEYNDKLTLHELFEKQVCIQPSQTAIICDGQSMTYSELNLKANQLAGYLLKNGMYSKCIVGIMAERTLEMIVAMFAVLKMGSAYIPIDPNMPDERIQYILKDSQSNILITQKKLQDKASRICKSIICIDDLNCYLEDSTNLLVSIESDNLAYVIYTSGSTGNPKGVMIEHRSVNNFYHAIANCLPFEKGKKILALTTMSFDIFVLETIVPLICGMCVVIASEDQHRNPKEIARLIEKENISVLQVTPSRLQLMLDGSDEHQYLKVLSEILIGGEAFPEELLTKLKPLTNARIFNMYGPTETTVWSTFKELTDTNKITIGKPLANTQVYIVDNNHRLLPVGVQGELCISGDGLARGYLKRPELTEEKFVSAPFLPDTIMYKTGDNARWLDNGEIECIGRLDYQVKIRGHRIELGEIESVLLQYTDILQVVVVVMPMEGMVGDALCAYFSANKTLSINDIKEYLNKKLPVYMIPSHYKQLDNIPLNTNGKIDRNALSLLAKPSAVVNNPVKSSNEIEKKLIDLYSKTLSCDGIGINHCFFDLGGDSLNAMRLINNINKEFCVDIPLNVIFSQMTIEEIAAQIDQTKVQVRMGIERLDKQKFYPVSSSQKRLFILSNQLDESGISYNIPIAYLVRGKLEYDKFKKSVDKLIERHEALRTSFIIAEGKIKQIINKNVDLSIEYTDLVSSDTSVEQLIKDFIKPFDLFSAPLMRIKIIKRDDSSALLLFDIHHIISDGKSMQIIMKELSDLYNGTEVKALVNTYKDYAAWEYKQITSGGLQTSETYWMKHLNHGNVSTLNLSTDYPRPEVKSNKGHSIIFFLEKDVIEQLKTISHQNRTSMYMAFLSIYTILLALYSTQQDILVGSPVAGRTNSAFEDIIGAFVNTLVMRNQFKPSETFVQFLSEVKKNALAAYKNQMYPFDLLVEKLDLSKDISRNPLFDVMLIYHNNMEAQAQFHDIVIEEYAISNTTAKFDLTLIINESMNGFTFVLEYCLDLFSMDTAKGMVSHFKKIAQQIIKNPYMLLGDIKILSQGEHLPALRSSMSTGWILPPEMHRQAEVGSLTEMNITYMAPRNETEEKLIAVWKAILGTEKIGINDNYFKIGGDSIKAIQIISALRESNIAIEMAHIYKYQTIQALCAFLIDNNLQNCKIDDVKSALFSISTEEMFRIQKQISNDIGKSVKVQKIYPISSSQERILFGSLFHKDKQSFFEQIIIKIKGYFIFDYFKEALNITIKKHDILRSVFSYRSLSRPVQIVLEDVDAKTDFVDISNCIETEKKERVDNLIFENKQKGFNLRADIPIRIIVIQTDEDSYQIIWTHHHIALDGWSLNIVLGEVYQNYIVLCGHKSDDISKTGERAYQYSEYIEWLYSQNEEEAYNYWTSYLDGYKNVELLINAHGDASRIYKNEKKEFVLNTATTKALQETAKSFNITLNNLFQAIWGIVLFQHSKTDDIVYGITSSGRNSSLAGVDKMAGLFVNVLPLRLRYHDNTSFKTLAENIRNQTAQIVKYNYVSIMQLQQKMERYKSDYFNHVLVFENYPIKNVVQNLNKDRGPIPEILDVEYSEQTNYGLNVIIIPHNEIRVILNYNANLFSDEMINILKSNIVFAAQQVIKNHNIYIQELICKMDTEILN